MSATVGADGEVDGMSDSCGVSACSRGERMGVTGATGKGVKGVWAGSTRGIVVPDDGESKHACSNAWEKAFTLEKRCCGSLLSAIMTTSSTDEGIVGFFAHNDGGAETICWVAISIGVPLKGRSPHIHS